LLYPRRVVNELDSIPLTGGRVLQSPAHMIQFTAPNQDWAVQIAKIAEGDQDALTTLYDQSSRLIYGLLLRILSNAATAEEVLFDTYTQVWRQAVRYDPLRGNPKTWLITIARSRAIDRLRADRSAARSEEPLDRAAAVTLTNDTETIASNAEMRGLINAALANLPSDQRDVIELAFYWGLTHSELAAHLNLPLGTVKTRARSGMMKLRETLGPVFEGSR
jgi:RNA polymerase sigma-70 factor (ECF subfamily)